MTYHRRRRRAPVLTLVAVKSNSVRTELNYAFVANDASVLKKSCDPNTTVCTRCIFSVVTSATSCGILDAIVSGLLLHLLLSTTRRVGKAAIAVGVMALATTAQTRFSLVPWEHL